jgi:hypothetical protein
MRLKVIIISVFFLLWAVDATAQRLIYERVFDWNWDPIEPFYQFNDDEINTLQRYSDNEAFFLGTTNNRNIRWTSPFNQNPNRTKSLVCYRFNLINGDTLQKLFLPDTSTPDRGNIVYNPISGKLISVFRSSYPSITGSHFQVNIYDNQLRWRGGNRIVPSDSVLMPGFFSKVIPALDKGVYYIGARGYQYLGNNVQHWHVTKIDSLGRYQWGVSYPSTFVFGEVNHVEYTSNGNLLLSGWEGGQPVAKEIDDSTGNLVRTINFGRVITRGFAKVQVYQAPNNQFYINGQENFASGQPFRTYLGKFDSTGQKIWGSLSGDSRLFLKVFEDGSTWSIGTLSGRNGLYYKKNLADSTLAFALLISNDTNQTDAGYKIFNDAIFIGDGSAIFGGKIKQDRTGTYFGEAMYLCKIDNIGRPFVTGGGPQLVLSNQEKEPESEPNLQIYPNPFTNTLRLSHKGTAQLLDVHGRVILSQPVEAGEELQVSNLPKGMYLLRLQSVGGKMYVRKVVRE